jgi:hypothetical protein
MKNNDYIDLSGLLEDINPIFDKIIVGVEAMELSEALNKRKQTVLTKILLSESNLIKLDNFFANIEHTMER